MKQSLPIIPRLIRFRDAPRYLGMDRNRFNAVVRPYLTEIRIGKQGIAFDRLEPDAWAGQIISRNGYEACTISPLNQWGKLVEISGRDGIPGRLEMPCSSERQVIN